MLQFATTPVRQPLWCCLIASVLSCILLAVQPSLAQMRSEPPIAAAVRSIVHAPANQMDFAEAKLALDTLIDPGTDADRILAELDQMVATVKRMLGAIPADEAATSNGKLTALRAFLYRPGHWNEHKPFSYDHDDLRNPRHRLLVNYLATRKGNCISMPFLFVALGERLGLEVTLSTAPGHYFVKYTDAQGGGTYNLEATSGAGFTRDSHIIKVFTETDAARANGVLTDAAIASGAYFKTLSRQERH